MDQNSHKSQYSGAEIWSANQSIGNFVLIAPLWGLVLDLILPLPSSIINSILLSILGSTLSSAIWVYIKYKGEKSFKFYLRNFKNFLFTPNLIKVFGSHIKGNVVTSWLAVIFASTAIQIVIFTPGNSAYLSDRVTASIDETTGINFSTDCPKLKLYFYNEQIECRVRTGLLGITVPARATLSPLVGTSRISISLL